MKRDVHGVHMAEDREVLIAYYQESRAALLHALDGVGDASLIGPTLDGWSVKDHLAHVALWDDVRADEVARISAGHASAWRMDDAQGDAYNALGYALRAELTLEQVRWELATSRERLLDAIAAAT